MHELLQWFILVDDVAVCTAKYFKHIM